MRGGAVLRRIGAGRRRGQGCGWFFRRRQKNDIEDLLADQRQGQVELICDCGGTQAFGDEHPERKAAWK
jgi:hypothetical protein